MINYYTLISNERQKRKQQLPPFQTIAQYSHPSKESIPYFLFHHLLNGSIYLNKYSSGIINLLKCTKNKYLGKI